MLIHPNDKLHIITRQLFPDDICRHFAGEVQTVSENAVRIKGYVFVLDKLHNQFVRIEEEQVRIISLIDSGNIINVLPQEVNLEAIHYRFSDDNHMTVTDGSNFTMDIHEFV
jgi:hypothetical protein